MSDRQRQAVVGLLMNNEGQRSSCSFPRLNDCSGDTDSRLRFQSDVQRICGQWHSSSLLLERN